ncbi:MAG: hypothetical protein ABWX96_01525 [Propionibacteriaceae bacterium]
MAQQQKARKPVSDQYAQRAKTLASSVQRLRGWVGSDPSRTPELADALVELTAHRLLGHGYGAAAADAQEAVRYAAQLLTANGPIGPYTSVDDAARCVTAVVHVATIQAAAGLPEAAQRTVDSLQDLRDQLSELGLDERLEPRTAIWALTCTARSALATGEIASANAYADAVLDRVADAGLRQDPDATYLVVDADRLASDARWAAGRTEEALTRLHAAKDHYDAFVAGRLQEPGRISPALLERLSEPLFGLYRDMADRLAATGEADLGLVTRRALVDTLRGFGNRLGDPARLQLALAWSDLANDLLRVDRTVEAEEASEQASDLIRDWAGAGSYRDLVAAVRAQALTGVGRSDEAVGLLRDVQPAEAGELPSAAHALGLRAVASALRDSGEAEAAAAIEDTFTALKSKLIGEAPARSGVAALEDLARGVVSRGVPPLTWAPLAPEVAFAATTAAAAATHAVDASEPEQRDRETSEWLERERAEAHRLEVARLEQARIDAERRELERARAEQAAAAALAAEQARAAAAERLAAERQAAAEEAERVARKRRREERLEAHRLEVERQERERREAERLELERRLEAERSADPTERERWELDRLQAELAELERAEERERADRLEAERLAIERIEEPEPEVTPPEPAERAAAEPAETTPPEGAVVPPPEPAVVPFPEPAVSTPPEPVEGSTPSDATADEPGPAPEPEAPDELSLAEQLWREARTRGDRKGARASLERVVELLRPRAEEDLAGYGQRLLEALEELSSARLRSGDLWGSRAPAKEAKALAKTLGR